MAPKYNLTYFPVPGRAEPARMMFHAAGVEFTDTHIPFAEWGSAKSDTKRFPLGQIPVLEVDGRVICQSSAIHRYLANEFGFYGANNEEKSIIDQICETLKDHTEGFVKIQFNKELNDEQKKEKYIELYGSDSNKRFLTFMTNILKSNNGGSGFFVGNKVSIADILILAVYLNLSKSYLPYLEDFPELKSLVGRIKEVEEIKKYLETRKS